MSKKIFSLILILITIGCLVGANISFAEEPAVGKDTKDGSASPENKPPALFQKIAAQPGAKKINYIQNLPDGTWQQIMARVINMILGITGSLALVSFTYGGILMVTAQGKDEQISKGKNILYWSVLALAIIAASYGIVVGITQLQFFK